MDCSEKEEVPWYCPCSYKTSQAEGSTACMGEYVQQDSSFPSDQSEVDDPAVSTPEKLKSPCISHCEQTQT